MLTNFLFSLLLVSQLGSPSFDAINSDWKLGEFRAPTGFRVIPEELVINIEKAGEYKLEVEIGNYTNQDVNFEVVYCPDNIKLSGLRGKSMGPQDNGKFTATLEVSEEDWQSQIAAAKAPNLGDQVGTEVHLKRNSEQADVISKIGAVVRDSRGNEMGNIDIPVFLRYVTDPKDRKGKPDLGSRRNTEE